MSQSVTLKAKGLSTFPNTLSENPEGSLLVADNVVIDRNSVIEPRRGFAQYGDEFPDSDDRCKQLISYKERLLRHFSDTIEFDNGTGTFDNFDGDYTEPSAGIKIKYLEANGNLYFTSDAGIKVLSASSAAQLTDAAGVIRDAGTVKALDVTGTVDYSTAGFLASTTGGNGSKVAYRIVWGYKDNNNNLKLGTPSSRVVITNFSDTDSGTVNLEFAIPSGIATTDVQYFYQIYRTAVFEAAFADLDDLDPGDEMNLVIEDFPTSNELVTTRLVVVNDLTPEDFRAGGTLLYTNPVSGEGILQANDIPPLAQDIASFRNVVFYANTQTRHRLNLALLSVSDLVSGVSSITIDDGTTDTTYTFVGAKEQTNLTFDTYANTTDGSYFLINSASNLRKYAIYMDKTGTTAAPVDVPEITEFTFDTFANTTDGGYFLLNSALNVTDYFVWADKTGATATPNGADTVGKTGVRVNISAAVTDAQVATAFAAAINALADFEASAVGADVTVTNVNNGNATDPTNGLVALGGAFAINVTQQGSVDLLGRLIYAADISGETTAAEVAIVVGAVLNSIDDFDAEINSAIVTVTNTNNGNTDNAAIGAVPPGGAFAIAVIQQGDGENAGSQEVLLSAAATPSQQIDETARSLVNIINKQSGEIVEAFYLSGPDDVPGLILLEAKSLNQDEFFVICDDTDSTGEMFSPTLPDTGETVNSDNEIELNALYYSKFQEPEAVPLVNKFSVGPKDKAILRILALRDSLFIFKEDAIYRLTGQPGAFTIDPFDNSTILIASDSAVVLNNQIYMLSTQGVATVSDTGVSIISRPIEDKLTKIVTPAYNFATNTFGVSYESDRAYLLWTVTATNDDTPTQCFRYNTFTNSWTRFPISKTAGVVHSVDNRLYLGAADEAFIEQERKDYNRKDYADREFDLTIIANGVLEETLTLSSSADVSDGDVVVQTQYLTIYQFNQLLRKLDLDFGPADDDYYDTLVVSPGVNFRDALDDLAAKLDADAGVADTDYLSSIGALSTFVAFQNDFNTIVEKLNLDTGVVYANYSESEGTREFEAPVVSKIRGTNQIIVNNSIPFIRGAITLFKGIESTIVWSPQHMGDPSIRKHISEGTFIFEDTVFFNARVGFSSDLSPYFEFIDFDRNGVGDFGLFNWGEHTWGGEGTAVPLRTYIPRNKQRCRFIKPRFEHIVAREKFSLFGISLSFRPIGPKAYRE